MAYTLYHVKRHDQLYQIMLKHYGNAKFVKDKELLTKIILQNNPHIKHINLIFPGQVIMLPDPVAGPSVKALPPVDIPQRVIHSSAAVCEGLSNHDEATKAFMGDIDYYKLGKTIGSGFVDTVGKITESAIPDVKQIALEYYRKEAKTITRGQYDYRRSKNIKSINHKIGPLHSLIHPTKNPGQVLRIKRFEPVRTRAILEEAEQLQRISRLAKRGNVILKAVDIADTMARIHYAESNEKRTELLVDKVSDIGGALLGAGLFVVCVGSPVGWMAVTAMAVAAAVGSEIGERGGKLIQQEALYDAKGNRITTKLDRIWNALY